MFSRLGAIIDSLILITFLVLMSFAFIKYNSPKDMEDKENKKEKGTVVKLVQAGGHGLLFIADLFKKTEELADDNSEIIEEAKSSAQLALNEMDNLTKAGMEEIGYQEFEYENLKEQGFWQDAWKRIKSANFISLWQNYWQTSKD
jgi:hypothetical protein